MIGKVNPFKLFCFCHVMLIRASSKVLRTAPVFIDQALVSGGSFLTVAISAHNLNLYDQGKIGYLLTCYLAINIVNSTVIFQWASYNAPRVADRTCYMRQLAVVQFALALITVFISVVGLWLVGSVSGWHLSVFEVVGASLFFFFQQLSDFSRRVAYLFQTPCHAAIVSASVYLPRLALMAGIAPSDLAGTIAIMGATSFLPALRTFSYAARAPCWCMAIKHFLSDQPTQSRWLMVSGPLIWASSSAPLFIAGSALSLAAVGAFITVRSLTNVANVAMEILETDVSARAGRISASNLANRKTFFRTIFWSGFVIWAAGMVLFLAAGDKLLDWIFGAGFTSYASVLNIMWLATGVNFLFRLSCVEERSRGHGRRITLAYASAALVAVLFTYTLVSWFGVQGISWVILLSITCSLIVLNGKPQQYFKSSE